MASFEIREGDRNQGCFRRGTIEAENAYDALRKASRTKMIFKTRDVVLKRDINGDEQFAVVCSYVKPIFGDSVGGSLKLDL